MKAAGSCGDDRATATAVGVTRRRRAVFRSWSAGAGRAAKRWEGATVPEAGRRLRTFPGGGIIQAQRLSKRQRMSVDVRRATPALWFAASAVGGVPRNSYTGTPCRRKRLTLST